MAPPAKKALRCHAGRYWSLWRWFWLYPGMLSGFVGRVRCRALLSCINRVTTQKGAINPGLCRFYRLVFAGRSSMTTQKGAPEKVGTGYKSVLYGFCHLGFSLFY